MHEMSPGGAQSNPVTAATGEGSVNEQVAFIRNK